MIEERNMDDFYSDYEETIELNLKIRTAEELGKVKSNTGTIVIVVVIVLIIGYIVYRKMKRRKKRSR